MRKLANHLDTGAMSLYNHVANKDELLDAMVDHIAGEFTDPPPSDDWKERARHIANETHAVLLQNAWALPLWPTRWPGPNRWRHMENLLAVLADADFPDDEHADLAFHAITLHIQGFTQQQASYATGFDDDADVYARFDAEVDAATYPRVVDHLRFHREGGTSRDEFEFVLDLILDGLERTARRKST